MCFNLREIRLVDNRKARTKTERQIVYIRKISQRGPLDRAGKLIKTCTQNEITTKYQKMSNTSVWHVCASNLELLLTSSGYFSLKAVSVQLQAIRKNVEGLIKIKKIKQNNDETVDVFNILTVQSRAIEYGNLQSCDRIWQPTVVLRP